MVIFKIAICQLKLTLKKTARKAVFLRFKPKLNKPDGFIYFASF